MRPVLLSNRFEGLCVPGGIYRYQLMSKALMDLLPCLIPGSLSPQINAALTSVRYESNNGYDYLWRILELTVPEFDPVVSIQVPHWSNSDDIFSFAQVYLLHFCLLGKLNFHYKDRMRSGIFLRAIQLSNFADTVTTLQSHVNSFREPYDDGYLPPHLCLHGLATSIHQNTQARMRDIISPRVHCIEGSPSVVQGVPAVIGLIGMITVASVSETEVAAEAMDGSIGTADVTTTLGPHGNALVLIAVQVG
jgi:hypothetical protein